MNKKIKVYKVLFVALVSFSLHAGDGSQILYSINMPGNPFQQPYYQMMVKADNKNSVYPFSSTNLPQILTLNACSLEGQCGSYWDTQMNVTSDYVSLYADTMGNGSQVSIMYGLSPYVFRGYTEGAASKFYMQRPAQVQLPFNPLVQIQSQNGLTVPPINATLPDYSDVFLAQKAADLYTSLGCATPVKSLAAGKMIVPCTFKATNDQMPSWYSYIPRDTEWRGSSVIFYGTIASLAKPNQLQTSFSPYNEEPNGWYTRIAMGVSPMSSTNKVIGSTGWLLPKGIFSVNGWLSSYSGNGGAFASYYPLVFAPIVSPGYAGDATQLSLADGSNNPVNPLQTVLAAGDLTGNYSVSNFPYIASGNQATTYDGVSLNNGMSYFQVFAQNMQWFSLQAPLQTPITPPFSIPQNVTPGQGIFSDAIQLAAMEAPASNSKGIPVFTGSLGATAGITGPVIMNGAGQADNSAVTFKIPQAFLSELTVAHFKVGRYLQAPLATQMNGTWSGGLVQAASEDPLQYYQGVTPLQSGLPLMPYLPVYLSDPGRPVDQPGWNYCPLAKFNAHKNDVLPVVQTCYDTVASPMTNFYTALNGTR